MYSDSKEWYLDAYVSPDFGQEEQVSTNTKGWGAGEIIGSQRRTRPEAGFLQNDELKLLAIRAARCPQLAGHEVIRRPRTTDEDFAVLQLTGGA